MKTLNLALGLAAGLAVDASACASAADVTPLTYDWTGFYLGAQAGYGWGDNTFTYVGGVGPPQENVDVSGLVGGVTLGANRQFGNIVLGLEGDISYSGISGKTLSATRPCIAEGCTEDVDWFGTGRVRLGYAMDQILPFVSGGLAIGNISAVPTLVPVIRAARNASLMTSSWAGRWEPALKPHSARTGQPRLNTSTSISAGPTSPIRWT